MRLSLLPVVFSVAAFWGCSEKKNEKESQLNDTTAPVTQLTAVRSLRSLSSGPDFCGVGNQNSALCWSTGSGPRGEPSANPTIPTTPFQGRSLLQVDTYTGYKLTCGLEAGGTVNCTGFLPKRQANGAFTLERVEVPQKIEGLENIIQIAVGEAFLCALRSDQKVLCFGQNDVYQAGADKASLPFVHEPRLVSGLEGVKYLTAGKDHACAIAGRDSYCWGSNKEGQLGNVSPDTATPVKVDSPQSFVSLDAGPYKTCGVMSVGVLFCWGKNDEEPQLVKPHFVPGPSEGVKFVSVGETTTCVVGIGGSGYCWGSNTYGELGAGFPNGGSRNPLKTELSQIKDISVGTNTVCATKIYSDEIYCWGVLTIDDDISAEPLDILYSPYKIGSF